MIIHLGDEVEDASLIELICNTPVQKVAGNCDPPGRYPREINTTVGQTRVLLTHGDRYSVKSGLTKLVERAVATDTDVVLYGHTHHASIDEIDGILLINPGSLHQSTAHMSYASLIFHEGGTEARIVMVEE